MMYRILVGGSEVCRVSAGTEFDALMQATKLPEFVKAGTEVKSEGPGFLAEVLPVTMVPVKTITLGFSERGEVERGKVFTSFAAVTEYLEPIAHRLDPEGGYWKTDFDVEWEDENTWHGTLDMKHDEYDIGQHIEEYAKFYAGQWKPSWMKQEAYDELIESQGPESAANMKNFLETYTLS